MEPSLPKTSDASPDRRRASRENREGGATGLFAAPEEGAGPVPHDLDRWTGLRETRAVTRGRAGFKVAAHRRPDVSGHEGLAGVPPGPPSMRSFGSLDGPLMNIAGIAVLGVPVIALEHPALAPSTIEVTLNGFHPCPSVSFRARR